MTEGTRTLTVYEVPLQQDLLEELVDLWEVTFETTYDGFHGILAAHEQAHNHDLVYVIRYGRQLGGTSHLTASRSNPELGGLGEVATPPAFRGRGVATEACARARDGFHSLGGQALFLGTVNPAAARIYTRLGWRRLAGATVYALIAEGESPEAFLVDYFRDDSPVSVRPASAAERIPMIPLLLTPHDWQVLDANAGLYSTRYAVQGSCMGLYPRYEAVIADGRGAWFAARTGRNRLVGLSTARLDGDGVYRVDGFTHTNHETAWNDLIGVAEEWGLQQGASRCRAVVSAEDETKQARFDALGYSRTGTGDPFSLGTRQVPSLWLEKAS